MCENVLFQTLVLIVVGFQLFLFLLEKIWVYDIEEIHTRAWLYFRTRQKVMEGRNRGGEYFTNPGTMKVEDIRILCSQDLIY